MSINPYPRPYLVARVVSSTQKEMAGARARVILRLESEEGRHIVTVSLARDQFEPYLRQEELRARLVSQPGVPESRAQQVFAWLCAELRRMRLPLRSIVLSAAFGLLAAVLTPACRLRQKQQLSEVMRAFGEPPQDVTWRGLFHRARVANISCQPATGGLVHAAGPIAPCPQDEDFLHVEQDVGLDDGIPESCGAVLPCNANDHETLPNHEWLDRGGADAVERIVE